MCGHRYLSQHYTNYSNELVSILYLHCANDRTFRYGTVIAISVRALKSNFPLYVIHCVFKYTNTGFIIQ